MRRARIKAVATVPSRRKPVSTVTDKDNSNSTNETSSETAETNNLLTAKVGDEVQTNVKEIESREPVTDVVTLTEISDKEDVQNKSKVLEKVKINESKPAVSVTLEKNVETISLGEEAGPSLVAVASPSVESASIGKISTQPRSNFMRPTPRLDGGGRIRRNSIQGSGASASESEDETRRTTTNRVTNDCPSLVISPIKGPPTPLQSTPNSNTTTSTTEQNVNTSGTLAKNSTSSSSSSTTRQKRKMVVSESARKLAESRREFLLKHEDSQPDRTKLIMYDLIYYNPVTNPMNNKSRNRIEGERTQAIRTTTDGNNDIDNEVEEVEDDEDDADDEEASVPVPQVKVGPDGALIIDEQSLVIEHTGAKKNRQALAKTQALIDDGTVGNGFYKKRKKTKDWSDWETVMFYKALNTVGTDFLLMKSVLPTRTRQELKIKFKKEEKTNRRLVEKALTYHQEFNIETLKKDLATFEESGKRLSEAENLSKQNRKGVKRRTCKSRRIAAMSICEFGQDFDIDCPVSDSSTTSRPEPKRVCKQQRRGSLTSSERDTRTRRKSTDSTSNSNESDSDTEIYEIKPTRSGRVPKVRKLQAPTINTLDKLFSDHEEDPERIEKENEQETADDNTENSEVLESMPPNDHEIANQVQQIAEKDKISENNVSLESSWQSQNIENSLSGISQVEPGSLVIVSQESTESPGETLLQVYMVSSHIDKTQANGVMQNMTPVVLTSELLNTVTAGMSNVAPINVKTSL